MKIRNIKINTLAKKIMNTEEEIYHLKKELIILKINKMTKQKFESHRIKKIQHQISQMNQLNNNKKS
uniref:50S ribosomal protein L29 n=1 Tax=Vertebrata lanosa TaxID=1261582 RepID=A0A0B5VQN0_9FLOR|nr:50S ribosomal protein L29 [Vertebrata lanosa]AJH65922.1 50S ribosomal protein L29 [Vertebrata lanosa]